MWGQTVSLRRSRGANSPPARGPPGNGDVPDVGDLICHLGILLRPAAQPTSYGHPGTSRPLPLLHTLAGTAMVVVADAVYVTGAAATVAPCLPSRPLPEPQSKSPPQPATLPVTE